MQHYRHKTRTPRAFFWIISRTFTLRCIYLSLESCNEGYKSDQQQQEEPGHRFKTVDGQSNSSIRWSLRPTSAGGSQARQPTQSQNLLSLVDCDKDVRCQGKDSSSGSQRKRRRVSEGEIMLEESKFNAAADSNRTVATTI